VVPLLLKTLELSKMSVKPGDKIAVWFSCGAASAVAAKKTLDKYGDVCTVRVINNPVAEEHPDNQRFLKDVEKWLGLEIETAINPKFPSCSAMDVWAQRKFMGGIAGAPCTLELKKVARQHWESLNPVDWTVLGFTADEEDRSDRFRKTERKSLLPVLIDERVTKKDCFRILFAAGIEIPEIYKLGYPNANCIGCIKATSPTYWNHVRRIHPEVFEQRAQQSREIGARLVRVENERMFLDELDPMATGASMVGMDFECGSFCEERTLFSQEVELAK
jgi:3'-phosphoadenosine 5'-phosphosulfate sulfotransferase (PAPS reductase)/FAD synthetase